MGLTLKVTADTDGPAFNGLDEAAIFKACRAIEEKTATFGAAMIRARENATFKIQTPYYRLQVAARREPPGWKISDNGVIYGPWLEGTGSRNRTTRFKGYSIWRKSVAEIQRHMDNIAEIEVDQALVRAGEVIG